jgi:hypothetical protein
MSGNTEDYFRMSSRRVLKPLFLNAGAVKSHSKGVKIQVKIPCNPAANRMAL